MRFRQLLPVFDEPVGTPFWVRAHLRLERHSADGVAGPALRRLADQSPITRKCGTQIAGRLRLHGVEGFTRLVIGDALMRQLSVAVIAHPHNVDGRARESLHSVTPLTITNP